MNALVKNSWKDDYHSELNADLLRKKFFPLPLFDVDSRTYPRGESIHGISSPCKCFILSGRATYNYDGNHIVLECGDYADLPRGKYTLCVDEEDDLEIVYIWENPVDS